MRTTQIDIDFHHIFSAHAAAVSSPGLAILQRAGARQFEQAVREVVSVGDGIVAALGELLHAKNHCAAIGAAFDETTREFVLAAFAAGTEEFNQVAMNQTPRSTCCPIIEPAGVLAQCGLRHADDDLRIRFGQN